MRTSAVQSMPRKIAVAQFPALFCLFLAQTFVSQTRTGWTIGTGTEGFIAPHWTLKAESLYYDLGKVDGNYTLNQVCSPSGGLRGPFMGNGFGAYLLTSQRIHLPRRAELSIPVI